MRLIRPHGRTFSTAFPPHGGAAGGGGGGFTAPNIWPNNGTEGWECAGATDDQKCFGSFPNGIYGASNQNIFSGTGSNLFSFNLTGGPFGGRWAGSPYVGGSGGGGADGFIQLPNMRKVCVRWALRMPTNTENFVKLMRLKKEGVAFISTPGLNIFSNNFILHSDCWDGTPDDAGIAPPLNTWVSVVYWIDLTNNGADDGIVVQKLRINNGAPFTVSRDHTGASPDPKTVTIDTLEVDGTINPPNTSGTEGITLLGIADFELPPLSGI
jgi:hypothetical protein